MPSQHCFRTQATAPPCDNRVFRAFHPYSAALRYFFLVFL